MGSAARRVGLGVGLAIVSTTFSLVAAELVLRAAAPAPRAYRVWRPGLEATFHPAPGLMPGISGPSRFTTNQLGLRGPDWGRGAGLRILAIGGSTTESLYLDDAEVWTSLLQQRLDRPGARVWVANGGKSGLNSRHHVVQALRLLEQHPEVDTLLVLAGVNDLHHRLSLDDDYVPIDREPPATFEELAWRSFAVHPAVDPMVPPWRPVELSYRLSRLGVSRLGRDDASPATGHLVQDDAGRVYEKWRRHRAEAPRQRRVLPDLDEALREYAGNLVTIADVGARHGVEVVFATQPVLWSPELGPEERARLWFGGVGHFQREPGHEYYSVEALAEGMARYNEVTLAVCAKRGLRCVDLTGLSGDPSVFYDDCHFNERGSLRVAELVAEGILGAASSRSYPSYGAVTAGP